MKKLVERIQVFGALALLGVALVFFPAESKRRIVEELLAQAGAVGVLFLLVFLWPVLPARFKRFATNSELRLFNVLILLICIVGALFLMIGLAAEARAPKAMIPIGVLLAFIAGFGAARFIVALAGWLKELVLGRKAAREIAPPPNSSTVECAGCHTSQKGGVIDWAYASVRFSSFAVIGYFCANCEACFCEKCKRSHLKWSWWSGFEHSRCARCGDPFKIGDCLIETVPRA